MALLEQHGLPDLIDHDAFFDVFYDEDLRFDYMQAFKKFTKCLNLVFPGGRRWSLLTITGAG